MQTVQCLPLYEGVDWNRKAEFYGGKANVSLFTREWIEICRPCHPTGWSESPSLRGSGLKCTLVPCCHWRQLSPSLRGSGLKFSQAFFLSACFRSPSLRGSGLKFHAPASTASALPSPSLRGSGLKCTPGDCRGRLQKLSPSLRGSGLKCTFDETTWSSYSASPSLRGSGLKFPWKNWWRTWMLSPSLRGSGLKLLFRHSLRHRGWCLPLYEGVDWNQKMLKDSKNGGWVSLFTREWIEIKPPFILPRAISSPSLRGSGLKCCDYPNTPNKACLPLYEGVDWNIDFWRYDIQGASLPLYEGVDWNVLPAIVGDVCKSLPLYEGVDWNREYWRVRKIRGSLPLYEGVDWNNVRQIFVLV